MRQRCWLPRFCAPSSLHRQPARRARTSSRIERPSTTWTRALLLDAGVDVEHTGFRAGEGQQTVHLSLFPSQADTLEDRGVELEAVEVEASTMSKSLRQAIDGGDSPNPFYTVYRSYSEPGGILDEMEAIAAEHRDIVKLMTIGHTTLGKPIKVVKITNDARNTPDNTRIPVLYSAVNHAREWIAAETNRRLMNWFVDNRDSDLMQSLLQDARAVGHADHERRRLRLHVHVRRPRRGGRHVQRPAVAERQPAVAQEPARQRRRRPVRRRRRRRRPEPQLLDRLEPRPRGLERQHRLRDLPRPVGACRSPRTRRTTACCAASTSSSSSTTTRRRSFCCTRSGPTPTTRRPTTASSRRSPARTATPRSTRTSRSGPRTST